MTRILVAGSMNMDIVTQVERLPFAGETIHGIHTAYYTGGKGANQAVAAARAGAKTAMAGALGNDLFAKEIERALALDQIDLLHVKHKAVPSGTALITIDRLGANQIILSAGANKLFAPEDLALDALADCDLILLQNEIPFETNLKVMQACRELPVRVCYNPAPARGLRQEELALIDLLVVNEIEAELLSGLTVSGPSKASEAALYFIHAGVDEVIVTLGQQGSIYANSERKPIYTPAFEVDPVDSTAAGDTFIGAFAAKRLSDDSIERVLRYATAASALTVTREGAQASIPTDDEIRRFLTERGGLE